VLDALRTDQARRIALEGQVVQLRQPVMGRTLDHPRLERHLRHPRGQVPRNTATAAFLKLVDIVAGQIDEAKPEEAKKRAMVAVSTMIGALTMSRIMNDRRLSKSLLRNAQEALTENAARGGRAIAGLR
jgi:hypothetical protein